MKKEALANLDNMGIQITHMDQYNLLRLLHIAGSKESEDILEEMISDKSFLSEYGERVTFNVGDVVFFGHYNIQEIKYNQMPICWDVLEMRDNKALLLSHYILPSMSYKVQMKKGNILGGWKESNIYRSLNTSFIEGSFTPEERKFICFDELGNHTNTPCVFLLGDKDFSYPYSYPVLFKEKVKCIKDGEPKDYWLRTMQMKNRLTYNGKNHYNVYCKRVQMGDFKRTNEILNEVDYPSDEKHGIRPAIWVSLEKHNRFIRTFPSHYCVEGNKVTLGKYPYYSEGEALPINWIVVKVTDEAITLISEKVLDWKQFEFNTERINRRSLPWLQSSIRLWLNKKFISLAFSEEEQHFLLNTTSEIGDDTIEYYTPYRGSSTTWKNRYTVNANRSLNSNAMVMLPSYSECPGIGTFHRRRWLINESDKYWQGRERDGFGFAIAEATPYAISQGAQVKEGKCSYWLRSLGEDWDSTAIADEEGWLDTLKSSSFCGIRPVIRINLRTNVMEYIREQSRSL